ncbi:TolC family protein [Candidatus Dependentiae bacterium]|nr:TolC family protein [Candidatus Dependentiae bacterium]
MKLTLEDCLRAGLNNNFDVKISKINLEIKEQDIIKKESEFDPDLSVSLGKNSNSSNQNYADFSITKKTQIGTNLQLSHSIDRDNYNSSFGGSSYNSNMEFKIVQPLLKNAGKTVNTVFLKIENNNKVISENDLTEKIMQLSANIEKKYWDLVYYVELLELKKQNLKLAEDLLENNKKQVMLGSLAPVEITRAAAGAANREEGIITAENSLNGIRDDLLNLMNIADTYISWNGELFPEDKPSITESIPDLKESVDFAFSNLPEYLTFKKKLENSSLKIEYYKNQELPAIDLETTFKLNGIDGTWVNSYEEMSDYDNKSWSLKFGFKIPIGDRYNKSTIKQEKLINAQLVFEFKKLEQNIILNIKSRIREIGATLKRISSAKKAYELAQENYKIELKRFELNQSTTYDVLEFQEALMEAQTNLLKAITDNQKAVTEYRLVAGKTLLENKLLTEFEEK